MNMKKEKDIMIRSSTSEYLTYYDLLQNAGKISMEIARTYAETEWEKFRIVQDRLFESDFDRFL
jgi:hypothetical protein